MNIQRIALSDTGLMHSLTSDYLTNVEGIRELYAYLPSLKEIGKAISDRSEYPVNREVLAKVLKEQYAELLSEKPSGSVEQNINLILAENTFTITTGHQLNIFTGPLYFIYKIISAIKLASEARNLYPQYNFIPVYWMASEDHDLEEINHFHLWGRTFTWETDQKGAVGRMDPHSLEAVIKEFETVLGKEGEDLIRLFKSAYLEHSTLTAATRYLVHSLFEEYGLICIDALHPDLKRQFASVFQQDMLRQNVEKAVNKTTEKLQAYKLPVNPRSINVFYLTEEGRFRIVDEDGFYQVKELNKKWKVDDLLQQIEEHPEDFSPNVVLRPIYQEIILPNLAYVGGTNEIAYWLELKQAFSLLHVFYPQLIVRDSALWIGKKINKEIQNLGLSYDDILLPLKELKKIYFERQEISHPAENTIDKLLQDYDLLKNDLQNLDKATVAAIVKSMNNHFKELKKWKSQVKEFVENQEEKNILKLEKIHHSVFPNEEFQERYDNFIGYYLKYGKDFFKLLTDAFHPAEGELHIFVEEN